MWTYLPQSYFFHSHAKQKYRYIQQPFFCMHDIKWNGRHHIASTFTKNNGIIIGNWVKNRVRTLFYYCLIIMKYGYYMLSIFYCCLNADKVIEAPKSWFISFSNNSRSLAFVRLYTQCLWFVSQSNLAGPL